jgi:hypothetical protein
MNDWNSAGDSRHDLRDATRYRWLREQLRDKRLMVRAQALFWIYTSRRDFDKAIDRAMLLSHPKLPSHD